MYSPSGHPRRRWVVSSTEQIWRNYLLTNGSSTVNGCHQNENPNLLVDYCEVFISCLDSRSDGTHSLQRIQWWVCNAKFLFWWRNKLILDGLSMSKYSSLNVNIYPGCWHVCSLAEQIMEFCKINSFARVLFFWSKLKFQWNAAKALQKEISRNRTVFC